MKADDAFWELSGPESAAGCGIKLRAYSAPYPQNSEIAELHKGLVLVCGQDELVEEGIGFGAVVARFEDEYFYSRTATVSYESPSYLSKTFELDSVARMGFRQPAKYNGKAFQTFYSYLAGGYQRFRLVQKLAIPLIELRLGLGVKVHYVRAATRGSVTFGYEWQPPHLKVNVDLSEVDRQGLHNLMIMNEQGGNEFTTYLDSDGNLFEGREVGAWMSVRAERATFTAANRGVSFSAEQVPKAELKAGRERIGSDICWSGFTYIVPPNLDRFSYCLKVDG